MRKTEWPTLGRGARKGMLLIPMLIVSAQMSVERVCCIVSLMLMMAPMTTLFADWSE